MFSSHIYIFKPHIYSQGTYTFSSNIYIPYTFSSHIYVPKSHTHPHVTYTSSSYLHFLKTHTHILKLYLSVTFFSVCTFQKQTVGVRVQSLSLAGVDLCCRHSLSETWGVLLPTPFRGRDAGIKLFVGREWHPKRSCGSWGITKLF